MNRFYNIKTILSRELLPWESKSRGLSQRTGLFELAQMIRFRSTIAGGIIECDEGEISDLASIPSIVEWFVMDCDDQRIAAGAWIHDKLYHDGGVVDVYHPDGSFLKTVQLTREQCDRILCDEAMLDLGASEFDRWKVYHGLRIGGCLAFKSVGKTTV